MTLRPPSRALAYALALAVTPVLHGLSFPPFGHAVLAWIAFVPWFAAIRLAGPVAALAITSFTTFAGSTVVASWLPRAVANYYGQPFALGVAFFVGVWAVTVAPFVLAFTLAYRALARRASWTVPLLAGAAWAATELCRVELLVGNPFGLLGYSQAAVLPLVQVADVTGIYGVSFVLAAMNAALAELWIVGRRALPGLGATVAVAATVLVYGAVRLASPPVDGAPPVRVAIAQANLDLGAQWRRELYGRNLDAYAALTREALGEPGTALVVWPESAMTFFLEDERLYRTAIARLLAPTGAELLAGGPRAEGTRATRYYNSAFLLSPAGDIVARYDKQRLLPFAEYFPFASVDLLRREFARVREFVPGRDTPPLPTAAGPTGVVICNEAMFPRLVTARVRAGARLLVNLTNDSWLGDVQYSAQALDMARVRAIEQRRWLVRASTSGPSALVDPVGRVTAETAAFSRGTIGGTVAPETVVSPYARWGDVFGLVCAAAVVVALATRRAALAGARLSPYLPLTARRPGS